MSKLSNYDKERLKSRVQAYSELQSQMKETKMFYEKLRLSDDRIYAALDAALKVIDMRADAVIEDAKNQLLESHTIETRDELYQKLMEDKP